MCTLSNINTVARSWNSHIFSSSRSPFSLLLSLSHVSRVDVHTGAQCVRDGMCLSVDIVHSSMCIHSIFCYPAYHRQRPRVLARLRTKTIVVRPRRHRRIHTHIVWRVLTMGTSERTRCSMPDNNMCFSPDNVENENMLQDAINRTTLLAVLSHTKWIYPECVFHLSLLLIRSASD